MKRILVTGSNGQLGQCFKKLEEDFSSLFQFYFFSSQELDITQKEEVVDAFKEIRPHFCINTAAYTKVDLAEDEPEQAFAVNALGVENLAKVCKKFNTQLIHISTDYVFDGETEISYNEEDFTNPIGIYAQSKKRGEELALENNSQTLIIRTSWLYSEFGNNFVKTMLRLFSEKKELKIVADQFGQPTNANDLAEAVLEIIKKGVNHYGIFHFSNTPETSWFSFAQKIAEFSHSGVQLHAIPTSEYPTKAARPRRSTLSLDKIETDYEIEPKNWEESLQDCIKILKNA